MKTAEREKLKAWAIDAGVRAIKTAAQTAVAMITVGQAVSEVSWVNIASVSVVAGIASLLTSVATIDLKAEADVETDHDDEKEEGENND